MRRTVFVINADENERRWIEATLASSVDDLVLLQDGAPLLAGAAAGCKACLVATAEPDEAETLGLVRDLRARGEALPVIVVGSHGAFRLAVDIARLAATDFLERPIIARQLRAAVVRALNAAG